VLDTLSELNAISFYEAQEDSKEAYYEIRQAIKNLQPVKPQESCDVPDINDGDIISRQAVLDMIEGFIADATSHGISARLDPYYVMDGIKDLPSVKPQEKTGHREYNDIYDHYLCGNCKTVVMDYDNYCPNCGCAMKGE
jgi:hypothetical protein